MTVWVRKSMVKKKDEITEDFVDFADLAIYQRKKGYRFSLDSILLAHFAIAQGIAGDVLDVGAGGGVLSMLIARLQGSIGRIIAVEIQKTLSEIAKKNVKRNGLGGVIEVFNADVRVFVKEWDKKFDAIISNPPFRKVNAGRVNPDEEKRIARHEYRLDPGDLSAVISSALKQKGKFFLIYPARRLLDVGNQFNRGGLKVEKVRLVHSFREREAEFALIRGAIGEQKETIFLSPLYIYDELNVYSSEIVGIFRGLIRK
jgi:tRNA1Val (adenine37-N6)-methyltransferase